jgi:hypothetical protein
MSITTTTATKVTTMTSTTTTMTTTITTSTITSTKALNCEGYLNLAKNSFEKFIIKLLTRAELKRIAIIL